MKFRLLPGRGILSFPVARWRSLLASCLALLLAVLPASSPAPAMLTVTELIGFAAGGGCSGNDSSTKLLVHADGADASTAVTDASPSAHTVTANGDAQIDTAESVFGGASALFDGTGDYLKVVNHADFNFGSGDFTIDFRAKWSATANYQPIISMLTDSAVNGGWQVMLWAAGQDIALDYNNGSGEVQFNSGFVPSTGVWYHVAVVRNGNNGYIFVDGVQQGSTYNFTGVTILDNATEDLNVGAYKNSAGAGMFAGWIDEVRITKGLARWTANFTPETCPYSFLLERDLDPAGNDNAPVGLRKVA